MYLAIAVLCYLDNRSVSSSLFLLYFVFFFPILSRVVRSLFTSVAFDLPDGQKVTRKIKLKPCQTIENDIGLLDPLIRRASITRSVPRWHSCSAVCSDSTDPSSKLKCSKLETWLSCFEFSQTQLVTQLCTFGYRIVQNSEPISKTVQLARTSEKAKFRADRIQIPNRSVLTHCHRVQSIPKI